MTIFNVSLYVYASTNTSLFKFPQLTRAPPDSSHTLSTSTCQAVLLVPRVPHQEEEQEQEGNLILQAQL